MKLNRFVISILMLTCSLHVMAGDSLDIQQSKFEQRLERRQNTWLSLIPTHFIIQNAGNMGTLSAGIGWSYGKNKKWETDLLIGFIPKHDSSRPKLTTTLKGNYIPWKIDLSKIIGKIPNDRLKVFADVAYQFTPNELVMGDVISRHSGSTGWFDFNVGMQYEIGQVIGWDKPGDKRKSVQTVSGHNWPRFIVNTGASVAAAYGVKTALKAMIKEERPDHSDNKSFPSGHASMAFAAARSIDKEFRKESIWIPIAGYAAATAVGIERVAGDRHHWYDVLAGAGVGIGSTELTWWLSDKLFGKGSNVAVGTSGNTVDVTVGF